MREWLNRPTKYLKATFKWIAVACLTGAIGGSIGALFSLCIEYVTALRAENGWLIYLLPVGGLLIVFLMRLSKLPSNFGTDQIIGAARTTTDVPILIAPLIFIGTAITHLLGGSAGREGAALQIGGSIGFGVGKLFKLDEKDMHMMVLCGMSAVFSAAFRAPLTGAIFVLEVLSVGEMYYGGLIPCITSSFVAYGIALLFGCEPLSFALSFQPDFTVFSALQIALIAALCGAVSIIFCAGLHRSAYYAKKIFKNDYVRIVFGAAIVIALTLIVGNRRYNGAGMDIIAAAMNGEAMPWDFILKIVFTSVTMAVGFKGGEIVPAFFVGAAFGCVVAPLVGVDAGFGAAIGFISMFCAVVNCPVASIILSVEVFGADSVLLFAIACGVSYTLSGYYGLYGSQKIMYSKLKAEFINKYTH